MDWDLKVPASWDLAELEHDAGAAAAPAAGPSGVHRVNAAVTTGGGSRAPAGNGGGRPECSVDLKLGGLGECELSGHGGDLRGRERPAAPAPAPAPAHASAPAAAPASSTGVAAAGAGAPRRPRPAGGGGAGQQCPSCAVDGCKADLSKCRDYHRRHKVCEAHSKTPVVVVAGREMRFCQQCSRFHQLAEFDETKRSCRKRLDGHNRRRRKPQPDPMTSANFITRQQGTRFSPFTTPRQDATWPGIIKTEGSPYYSHQLPLGTSNNRQQHFGVGSSSAYTKEGRRFPFLHQEGEISFTTGMVLDAASSAVCQPLLKTVAAPPETGGGGGSKMFSDGLTRVLDSDCALSLLSAPANSSNIDVTRMVRPTEQVPLLAQQQPLLSGLQFGTASWFPRPHQPVPAPATGAVATTTVAPTGMETEHHHQQMNAVLGGGAGDAGEMNYNGMFHVAGEGTFSWQE